jgi:phytoene/squalene synthetase
VPNEQWDDFALTQQFQAIDRRLDSYEDALRGLAHFPIDVATAALNIEHLTAEVRELREDWREETDARRKGRTAIVVAFIGGSATVLAAMVVLVGAALGVGS